jgi:uncharacterized protein
MAAGRGEWACLATVVTVRPLPEVTADNAHFWRGGEMGKLQLRRCLTCGFWLHPPSPVCRRCRSTDVGVDAVSGRGAIASFSINHQRWLASFEPPYVVAIVDLDEQPALRLTTNVVDCEPDAVTIGMRVEVLFEQHDDVWIPLFRPAASGGDDVR